ncbi:MAG: NAD(P)/FAD-dependent oxidoreductase [Salinirussus sp.]
MTTQEAIVVGGGIVGASVGYHLSRDGVETLLIDREDTGEATSAGAGSVGPATSSQSADDDWYAFATNAADYYPKLAEQLENAGAGETSYHRPGTLAVAIDEDEFDPYEEALQRIADRGIEVEEIAPSDAAERFPPLTEVERAFYDPSGAHVNGRSFTDALLAGAATHGLETLDADVTGIRVEDGAVVGVRTADGRSIDTGSVVIAGGAWSPHFESDLGIEVPVEPQRGQIVHLDVDAATGTWPITKGFRHHYIVPWADGRVVVGATRETGAGYDPRLTAEGVNQVLSEALRVAPGLADATIADLRVGLRPLSADKLPLLGAVPGVDGAYLATGHGPTGLTLGPYSGKVVAGTVTGHDAVPDRFAVDRFLNH